MILRMILTFDGTLVILTKEILRLIGIFFELPVDPYGRPDVIAT